MKGAAVVWEPAAVVPLSLAVADAALLLSEASLFASVAEATSVGRTPLGMIDSALLGIRDAKSEGMLVNCDCAVAPAATARLIKDFLILKGLCKSLGIF